MSKPAIKPAPAIALEAVCPRCKHVRSVQRLRGRPGMVRCTQCGHNFDPSFGVKEVPVDFLGGAEQGMDTANLVQWRRGQHPSTFMPQPVRKEWRGTNATLVEEVVKKMPPADRTDPIKRGLAYKAAIREWRPKDGIVDFTVKGFHQSFRQVCRQKNLCLKCLQPKKNCHCR